MFLTTLTCVRRIKKHLTGHFCLSRSLFPSRVLLLQSSHTTALAGLSDLAQQEQVHCKSSAEQVCWLYVIQRSHSSWPSLAKNIFMSFNFFENELRLSAFVWRCSHFFVKIHTCQQLSKSDQRITSEVHARACSVKCQARMTKCDFPWFENQQGWLCGRHDCAFLSSVQL